MTAEQFETKLLDLIDEAVTGGVDLDEIHSALDLRIMAIDEQLAE